ncbi:hypothetical protein NLU13_1948 [Sarocladium strictum]|uniref:Transcription initiation factor IIF subunit beta n=1 Tax=Sarocladium strictum TaxID=5046 RepID=A0AA39GRW2_SARSR|nr:hypothetical protein NLU13_1948 [Sarocladium strictum]
MADPAVKPEPMDTSPGDVPGGPPADEDDMYEDAGDLEFYDKNAEGNRFEALYLARLPKYLWESWAKLVEGLNDDDEVRLGTLRTWQSKDTNGEDKTHLRMLLQPHAAHQSLPVEYEMDVTDKDVHNHFIFSEEDLPGFKEKSKARSEAAASGMPASLLRPKNENTERRPFDRRSRFQPYYRKAVPKKTKIIGKIHYDMRVEPVDKREEEKLLERRLFEADHSKPGVQLITRDRTRKALQSGTAQAHNWGDDFVKGAGAPAAKPKKGEVFKAARIPENELIDLFWKCFGEYQFWSMKALRQRLQQPENYIRQVLNDREIAVLHKSGPFANHYELTDQYKSGIHAQKSAAAEEDDDDEGEEMEDVMPTS